MSRPTKNNRFEVTELSFSSNVDWNKIDNIIREDPNAIASARYLRMQTDPNYQNETFHIQLNTISNILQGEVLWMKLYREFTGDNNLMLDVLEQEYIHNINYADNMQLLALNKIAYAMTPDQTIPYKEALINKHTDEIYNRLMHNKEALVFSNEPAHAIMIKYQINNDKSISVIKYNAGWGGTQDSEKIYNTDRLLGARNNYDSQDKSMIGYSALEYKIKDPNKIKEFIKSEITDTVEIYLMEKNSRLRVNDKPELRLVGPVPSDIVLGQPGNLVMGQRFDNCSHRSAAECSRDILKNDDTFKKLDFFIKNTPVSELVKQANISIDTIQKNPNKIDAYVYKQFLPTYKKELLDYTSKWYAAYNLPNNFFEEKLKPLLSIEAIDYPLTTEMINKTIPSLVQSIQNNGGIVNTNNLDNITNDWYTQLRSSPDIPIEILASVIKIQEDKRRAQLIDKNKRNVEEFSFYNALLVAKKLRNNSLTYDTAREELFQQKKLEQETLINSKPKTWKDFFHIQTAKHKQQKENLNREFLRKQTPDKLLNEYAEDFDNKLLPENIYWLKEREIKIKSKQEKINELQNKSQERISGNIKNIKEMLDTPKVVKTIEEIPKKRNKLQKVFAKLGKSKTNKNEYITNHKIKNDKNKYNRQTKK